MIETTRRPIRVFKAVLRSHGIYIVCMALTLATACTTADVEAPDESEMSPSNQPTMTSPPITGSVASSPGTQTTPAQSNNTGDGHSQPGQESNNGQPDIANSDVPATPSHQEMNVDSDENSDSDPSTNPANSENSDPDPSSAPANTENHSGEDGTFSWSGTLAEGQVFFVQNVVGDIAIVPSDGDSIEITAVKTAVTSDINSVTFNVVTNERGVLICTMYPNEPGQAEQNCSMDETNLYNGENDVSVRYEMRIPADQMTIARTVTGNVSGRDLRFPVSGAAVTGSIELETTSYAMAETITGDITVRMGDPSRFLTPDLGVGFTNVSGQVSVTVPMNSSFDYSVSTVSGQMDIAFPHQTTPGLNAVEGRAGQGGPFVELASVNGTVELLTAQ